MAHFAQLDSNNVVTQVIVIHNNELKDETDKESEAKGIAFCKSLFGQDTNWIQTSYNNNFRKKYAGIGYTYNSKLDAFIPLQPYPSWKLNSNADWEAPIPIPSDAVSENNPYGKLYVWDEPTVNWKWEKEKQPYPSWTENETTGRWIPPVPFPSDIRSNKNPDGKVYVWDEPTINWIEYIPPEANT